MIVHAPLQGLIIIYQQYPDGAYVLEANYFSSECYLKVKTGQMH